MAALLYRASLLIPIRPRFAALDVLLLIPALVLDPLLLARPLLADRRLLNRLAMGYLMSGALAIPIWLARPLFRLMFPNALATMADLLGPSMRAL